MGLALSINFHFCGREHAVQAARVMLHIIEKECFLRRKKCTPASLLSGVTIPRAVMNDYGNLEKDDSGRPVTARDIMQSTGADTRTRAAEPAAATAACSASCLVGNRDHKEEPRGAFLLVYARAERIS